MHDMEVIVVEQRHARVVSLAEGGGGDGAVMAQWWDSGARVMLR